MATQLKLELPNGAFRRAKESVSFRKRGVRLVNPDPEKPKGLRG